MHGRSFRPRRCERASRISASYFVISKPACSSLCRMPGRRDEKCFVVRADEKLTTFVELESVVKLD
jgi:hypothetical protein